MADSELHAVITALKAGDSRQARALLQPLLRQPSADRWYMAALLCSTPQQAITALEKALVLDPGHERAQKRLDQLQNTVSPQTQHETISEDDLPPLAALIADEVVIPADKPYNPQPAAAQFYEALREPPVRPRRRRRKRTVWTYISIASFISLSLSSSYFVLLVLGSAVPGRLRSVFTGIQPVFAPESTIVYATPVAVIDGTPYYARPLEEYGSASTNATPVTEINGTPVYARPDAVVVVIPAKSTELTRQEAISDILEPGFAHEYVFTAELGEELAIGVQFFSPTAQQVGRNVAILDPDEGDGESVCIRERILQGDNGVAFICPIHKAGQWKLRLFGREGESSGAYVVAIEKFA